jgi:hypothetical protein
MRKSMKIPALVCLLLGIITLPIAAGTPEQEKAFTDKYKKAFEAKDTAVLESVLYTGDADPATVDFYKRLLSGEAGEKISNIELVNLTAQAAKEVATPLDLPYGGKACLPLKPTKKLIVKIEKQDVKISTEYFIAEKDGEFVIPVIGPCK